MQNEDYINDPSRFGGRIYLSDFETDYRGKDNTTGSIIASRIISDWRFDEMCKKNSIIRDKKIINNELKEIYYTTN